LRRNGRVLKLEKKPMELLILLISRQGELVSREEIIEKLWGQDVFIETEHGINTAVRKIRQTLGDDPERSRFVQTVVGKGYRFVGAVSTSVSAISPSNGVLSKSGHDNGEESADEAATQDDPPLEAIPHGIATVAPVSGDGHRAMLPGTKGVPPRVEVEPIGKARRFTSRTALGALAVLASVLLVIAGVWRLSRKSVAASLPPMEIVPMLGLNGAEKSPAFSPDGKQIALALHGESGSGIYVSLVSGGKPLQLTSGPQDNGPKWSPDGEQIAFYRPSDEGMAIYTVPVLGGSERRVYSGPATAFPHAFDWSPDGKYLAISKADPDRTHAQIALLSVVNSATRPLTTPSAQDLDYGPTFSPDGSTVAFVRSNVGGMVSELYTVPTAGGQAKRLTFDHRTICGAPAWTPDGNEVLFSAASSGSPSLWRVPASGGTPKPVLGSGASAVSPTLSRRSELVFQEILYQDDVWQVDLRDKETPRGIPKLLISAKGFNIRPQYSPDGKKIALESSRSGYNEIWVCDRDGTNCNSVTHFKGVSGAPRWSPDGKSLAFEFHPQSYSEVYIVEVGGGKPRLLATFPEADNGGPVWSRDGKWMYFYSDRKDGRFQIWKTPVSGGSPVQVTKNGGIFGVESRDGRFFYFAKFEEPGIWRMPINGGDETRILDHPGGDVEWCDWALSSDGIYFVDPGSKDEKASIQLYEFASRRKIPILILERRQTSGLGISPEEKSILFTQEKLSESRIVLVKNFR
jgi:Tol biopolymer transport system component/DNA-binding winged helix-turn-helix (wHTH) protein